MSGSGSGGGESPLTDMLFNLKEGAELSLKGKGVEEQIKEAVAKSVGKHAFPAGGSEAHMAGMSEDQVDAVVARAREAAAGAVAKLLDEDAADVGFDAQTYDDLYGAVAGEITQLRMVLAAAEAKEKERVWLKGQMVGEIDESKLVDSMAGEKSVFKRRGENDDPGVVQTKPKAISFVMDASSSMGHFNGSDRRLDRLVAATVLIMEAFAGFESKFEYSIVAHDGETPLIPLVEFGAPPKGLEDKLKVIKSLYWNASYCMSGDNTLAAASLAIDTVAGRDADDYFVVLVSDANLAAYGITDRTLGRVINSDPTVHVHAVFIAGVDDAQRLMSAGGGGGNTWVVLDTGKLPAVFREILGSLV